MTQPSVIPTIHYANPKEEIVTCSQKFCLLLNPGQGPSHRSPLAEWVRMNEDQGNATRKRWRAVRTAGGPTTGSGTRCLKQRTLQPFLLYFLNQLPEGIAAEEKNKKMALFLIRCKTGEGKEKPTTLRS